MTFAQRRKLYNACNPQESLPPGDPRNLDFDLENRGVRGGSWVDRLSRRIIYSDKPTCTLFTGLPGSGKSTELRRLEDWLARADQGAWLVVRIDVEDHLDLGVPIDLPDILALVVHEAERRVLQLEGRNEQEALRDGYLSRFWNWLNNTDVEFNKAEFTIPEGPKLVAELRTRESLRERMRSVVARNLSSFLTEVRSTLRDLAARVEGQGHMGIVVVVDSLEKLRGTSQSFQSVLASAERLFQGGAPYLQLPVHVVYTVPPALYNRIQGILFMPVIKLKNRQGARDVEGWAAMRELARRRVPDAALREMLGEQTESRLEQMLELSGGYPREVIQMLQELVATPVWPLADADFTRVLGERRAAYQNFTPSNAYDWLARVHRDHQLGLADHEESRRLADQMLSNNGILHYWNGDSWWGLHPAVAAIPGVQEAITRLAEPPPNVLAEAPPKAP